MHYGNTFIEKKKKQEENHINRTSRKNRTKQTYHGYIAF